MKMYERCQELRDEVRQEGLISVQFKKKKKKAQAPSTAHLHGDMHVCACFCEGEDRGIRNKER